VVVVPTSDTTRRNDPSAPICCGHCSDSRGSVSEILDKATALSVPPKARAPCVRNQQQIAPLDRAARQLLDIFVEGERRQLNPFRLRQIRMQK